MVSWLETRDIAEIQKIAPPESRGMAELLVDLFELLDCYGLSDRVIFDASIVRGLAYYTGIVFEAFDTAGELRALCGGGGRYDPLAGDARRPVHSGRRLRVRRRRDR